MTFFCDPAIWSSILRVVPSDCRTPVTNRHINSAKGVPNGTPSCTIGCWQTVIQCAKRMILMHLGDFLSAVRAYPQEGAPKIHGRLHLPAPNQIDTCPAKGSR